jgi:arylformamidase
MTERFYDISRTLSSHTGTWPGDVSFSLMQTFSQQKGDSVNVGCIQMSIHTATHIDAPYHFESDGERCHQLDLSAFWGPAQVVTVDRKQGALQIEDLAGIDLRLAPRLLLHTPASQIPDEVFPSSIIYPSAAFAEALAEAGIVLLGTDAPSMDALDDQQLPGHAILYRNGISILEGLNLSGVPDGLYELSAIPLKIEDADGSPVRAVLRRIK